MSSGLVILHIKEKLAEQSFAISRNLLTLEGRSLFWKRKAQKKKKIKSQKKKKKKMNIGLGPEWKVEA